MKSGRKASISVGQVYPTINYGDIKVIEYTDCFNVKIQFLDTQNIKTTSSSQIRNGSIADTQSNRICGVGYYDSPEDKKHPLYKRWASMISRCYSGNNKYYLDVEVCSEWLHFNTFAEDISKMENYNLLLAEPDKYSLDKDKSKSKIYSTQTVQIISKTENTILARAKAVSYQNETFESVSALARHLGVSYYKAKSISKSIF